jgi:hypothetical protein
VNKRDYFLTCMRNETYALRAWVISSFSVVNPRPHITEVTYPYEIIYDPTDKDALFFAQPTEAGGYTSIKIEGSKADQPLYRAKEGVDISAGSLPLRHDDMNTSYGIMLGNMYLLHYPFGTKFDFHNGVITQNFENHLTKLLTDDVTNIEDELPNRIYVREYMRYGEACGALGAYDRLFSASGSPKVLTIDPTVLALRDKLVNQYKDQLSDPRIQAMIEEQVVAADKASFKGDPAEDFLISGKSFNPTRKKLLAMIGGSAGFGGSEGGTASFIPTSLRDGWRVEDIPIHANEARAGSFYRGKETAMGGSDVKVGTRMGMNSKISEKFCGAKTGIPTTITKLDTFMYLGLYVVGKSGPILITDNNITDYVGKEIMIHSPTHCRTEGDGYCETCIGTTWSTLKNGVTNIITNIGDVFMYDKMKRMHGKALFTTTFHFLEHIG